MTQDQTNVATFADRIAAAMPVIEQTTKVGTSPVQQGLSRVPGVGNYLVSNDMQKLNQAQRDFINAVLRRESGAVISDQEFDNARKQYFPQPGDGPEVLEQKRNNRQIVLDGFVRAAGPQYKPPSPGKTLRYNPETGKIE